MSVPVGAAYVGVERDCLPLLHSFGVPLPADGCGDEGIDPTVELGDEGFSAMMANVVDSLGL